MPMSSGYHMNASMKRGQMPESANTPAKNGDEVKNADEYAISDLVVLLLLELELFHILDKGLFVDLQA